MIKRPETAETKFRDVPNRCFFTVKGADYTLYQKMPSMTTREGTSALAYNAIKLEEETKASTYEYGFMLVTIDDEAPVEIVEIVRIEVVVK